MRNTVIVLIILTAMFQLGYFFGYKARSLENALTVHVRYLEKIESYVPPKLALKHNHKTRNPSLREKISG